MSSNFGGPFPGPLGIVAAPAATAATTVDQPVAPLPSAVPQQPSATIPQSASNSASNTDPNGIVGMNESTMQFVFKVFSIALAIALGIGFATLSYVVIRDGNSVEVASATSALQQITIGGFISLATMVIGKPVAASFLQKAVKP